MAVIVGGADTFGGSYDLLGNIVFQLLAVLFDPVFHEDEGARIAWMIQVDLLLLHLLLGETSPDLDHLERVVVDLGRLDCGAVARANSITVGSGRSDLDLDNLAS